MIILTNTTDKIQVKLGGAVTTNQLPCFASYRDTTTSTIEAKRNVLNTNNATEVDLVDSPAASTQRIVDYISIYNNDTVTQTVTVLFNDNATTYNLFIGTLSTGERLEYQEGEGFKVMTTAGAVKISDNAVIPTASSSTTFVLKSADETFSATTNFTDVSVLNFAVLANKTYYYRFTFAYTANATTTGIRFAVNGPASPRVLYYFTDVALTTTSRSFNRGISTYDGTATSTTSAATGGNIGVLEGIITPSADGTLTARCAPETVAGGALVVVKAGSFVQYMEI